MADDLWYKEAIIYEVHIRSFYDSDGDGIGDIAGLTEKLDYLQDLGITALWLLPFYPSPLRDDGYDIADFTDIHPTYGTLGDFKKLLREAHRRGIRVITEMVLNHTSDAHPWFQRARKSKPGSSARDFYVWSDTPERYRDARIIFTDFESSNWAWDPVAKSYYWHRFYSHQPELNYENPALQKAVLRVLDFWLGMGVDGMRLDAVPYLFEKEGTSCENLPETHAFLKKIRRHVDRKFSGRMLLAEANQWPEDAVAYFGEGDETHMAFHFPLMPRLFMALRMEDRYPIIDILEQTPHIPDSCQWALFLRNHDELTLEMITDEERDYMYRMYAYDPRMRLNVGIRRRLSPLLSANRRAVELLNALLLSMPGTPVLYYGDEIGMGDNIYLGDRNGVRTPMQWSSDRNAGFSRANSQQLYLPVITDPPYHYESLNVDAQQQNPHSLLWWMKRIIGHRKRHACLARGSLEFLYPENRKVLAFLRRWEEEHILAVANLSRFVQWVDLDLSRFNGLVPVELFGHSEFPVIQDSPYFLSLGPHSFYWLSLRPEPAAEISEVVEDREPQELEVSGDWMSMLTERGGEALEDVLLDYLRGRRWFAAKARKVNSLRVSSFVPISHRALQTVYTMIRVDYTDGDPETYAIPLAHASGEKAAEVEKSTPDAVVCRLNQKRRGEVVRGLLYDAGQDRTFAGILLRSIAGRRRFKGAGAEISGSPTGPFRKIMKREGAVPEALVLKGEQSNTSLLFGDRFIMKLYRRIDDGVNPELDIGLFLTEKVKFSHTSPVAGYIEYRRKGNSSLTLGILHEYCANEGDAWKYTLDELGHYYEQVQSLELSPEDYLPAVRFEKGEYDQNLPPEPLEKIGAYLERAQLLGRRTAELHLALASEQDDPAFSPERFTPFYQRSLRQSMRNLAESVLETLRKGLPRVPKEIRPAARRLLKNEKRIQRRLRELLAGKINALRIRCHGDFHLGQVLFTGKDFVIIDFEGEPARPLSERRLKRCALRDVAGMLRSFHYAAYTPLEGQVAGAAVRPEDVPAVGKWADYWYSWVSHTYLQAYSHTVGDEPLLPQRTENMNRLLEAYLLDKAVYELGYELNNRPTWVGVPLRGIFQLILPSEGEDT